MMKKRWETSKYPSERHWILKMRDTCRREGLPVTDEDINNIWMMYSSSNGLLKKWLMEGSLQEKMRKETIQLADMESVRYTAKKISEHPIKQVLLDSK